MGKVRKYLRTALSVMLALALTAGLVLVPVTQTAYAAKKTVKAKSVTLNHKVYTIKKGKTVTLKAAVKPKNASQKKIVWTSSKKKVATVKNGKVKGLKKGKVTITAKVKGTKKTAKATIYIGTPVKKVTFSETSISLKKGESAAMKAKLQPASATVKKIYYSSSDKSVATVSSSGTITAKGAGTAVITAKPKDEAGKKAKLKVVVTDADEPAGGMKVAMITDSGGIDDQSFNQSTYEACKEYCEPAGIPYTYKKPANDEDSGRKAAIEKAIEEGYNVIVMPGFAFANAIYELAPVYPEVRFVGIDLSEEDITSFGERVFSADNFSSTLFREELSGYMAGYAAVRLGYKKLGFLGGMPVPAVMRYGYGFIQGADAAAGETGASDIEVRFIYGGAFWGTPESTEEMEKWYQSGTECVFACGGAIYSSAAEAAAKFSGKVIGVDVDQAPAIDGEYGAGITVTSAMKDIGSAVKDVLDKIYNDKWDECKGFNQNGGAMLAASTQWSDGFTKADHEKLHEELQNGTRAVSNNTDAMPSVKYIKITDEGSVAG